MSVCRAFYPVTDDVYITGLASQQLKSKKVNGQKLLVGHNANEGALFVPPTIKTEADLNELAARVEFPNLSAAQISSILASNPNSAATGAPGALFETNGMTGPNAVNVSQDANGQQQRGNNIYAEATFVCPSYWMSSAYTSANRQGWHYQYSVPFASHATDTSAYFGPAPNLSADFVLAFRRIWGNFVTHGNPSTSNAIANGASAVDISAANGRPAGRPGQTSSPSSSTSTRRAGCRTRSPHNGAFLSRNFSSQACSTLFPWSLPTPGKGVVALDATSTSPWRRASRRRSRSSVVDHGKCKSLYGNELGSTPE